MEIEDLVEKEIYYWESEFYFFIFQYTKRKDNIGFRHYIEISGKRYYNEENSDCHNGKDISKVKYASNLQKQWLNACIAANKYVECPKEENILMNLEIW